MGRLKNNGKKEKTMEERIDFTKANPGVFKAMYSLQKYVDECGLEHPLLELIKVRASQINGCAYCLDMHTKDARAAGETEQRLYALSAWQETPFYTERERAALTWTEAVTLVSEGRVPDEIFERVRAHFSDEELINLTTAIVTINSWNRFAISFRAVPGTYQPQTKLNK
jgi:AhpD family alkylhydroperoxidase